MDLFGKAYLQTLKDKFKQDSPSKAVMDALRQLQRINAEQSKQIRILKQHIEALKMENRHLSECLQHINHDHEEYRMNRQKRDRQNLAIELELRRQIQSLEWKLKELHHKRHEDADRDVVNNSQEFFSTDIVNDIVRIQKQILDLTESNQQLTRNLLSSSGDQMIDLRTQMRNNNKNIARLKAYLIELKNKEKHALQHTSRLS